MGHEMMAPLMFGGLIVVLLIGYPVAFALAANGLLRLAALTGETEFEEPATEVLRMLAHAGALPLPPGVPPSR